MQHLGVLPNGDLVEILQYTDYDESARRWFYFDVLPDGTPVETKTFLPFIWGYANWDRALEAFRAGLIRNINDMTRSWK